MRSGSEPQQNDAVESGEVGELLGRIRLEALDNARLLRLLIDRLGGPHAVIDQVSVVLDEHIDGKKSQETMVDEDTPGYCYLRLFDRVEHRDAKGMGPYPTVAEVRRFTNRRVDPFGTRSVNITIAALEGDRLAHVSFYGGLTGLRPVAALAALAKDCRIGGDSAAGEGVIVACGDRGSLDQHCLVSLRRFKEVLGCGHKVVGTQWLDSALNGGYAFVPNDLPFNVPDGERYPYARYSGLHKFVTALPTAEAKEYLHDLGANPGETQTDAFWVKAFPTSFILTAYFKLTTESRQKFVQIVTWVRDPVPGRPGGVQIPPPDWPSCIPTPVTHTMVRFAGIADWVAGLNPPWPEVCRMSLFGIHEPVDPIWWADYHKTIDVYIMYARMPQWGRVTFAATIYWIPDPGPSPGVQGPVIEQSFIEPVAGDQLPGDGYCYLSLFRPESRSAMRRYLGKNPWAASVAAALLGHPQMASGGTFAYSVDRHVESGKRPEFQQGHVEVAAGGLSAMALVGLFSSFVRLGATTDLNALMNLQGPDHVAAQPSVFPVIPVGGGPGVELSFNVFTIVGKAPNNTPDVTFNLLREPAFALLLGAFESVQLQSANFTIQVSTGSTNLVYAAICGPDNNLVTLEDWLGTHINTVVHGSDQGYVDSTLMLPSIHPFEKELRAGTIIGNPIPSFRFSFAGTANGTGTIKGSFTVRVRGQYVLGHVRFGASKSTKSHVARIVASLPYTAIGITRAPIIGNDSEDDDDDSDDDVKKHVKVIPPNVGNRQTGHSAGARPPAPRT